MVCLIELSLQQSREARYGAIKSMLEDNIKLRDRAEERFQSFFEREVHRLHNDVREESEVSISTLFSISQILTCFLYRFENVKMMRSWKRLIDTPSNYNQVSNLSIQQTLDFFLKCV